MWPMILREAAFLGAVFLTSMAVNLELLSKGYSNKARWAATIGVVVILSATWGIICSLMGWQ